MAARRSSVVGAGLEALISAGTLVWSARRARSLEVSDTEERIFRAFNDRSDTLHSPMWLLMQSGSYAAVFVAAGHVWWTDGPRRATAVFVLGTAVRGGVKMIKPSVGRGRPEAHLEAVDVARGLRRWPADGELRAGHSPALIATGACPPSQQRPVAPDQFPGIATRA